ncbi:MAG: HAMP domain-containing histidine kinase [Oscillospiraceae bacterium]|nr:HAMP domain-containing histidine kinase [Oscillospiraceae bacterium]
MKLKSKLLLATTLIFLLVFTVCIGALLLQAVQSTTKLLTDNVASEQKLIEAHFLRQMHSGDEIPQGLAERSRAEYVFRRISLTLPTDAWYILLRDGEVLQNDSGVSVSPAEASVSGIIQLEGKQYCLSKAPCPFGMSVYTVAVIRDVSEQMDTLYHRTLRGVGFALFLLLTGLAVLYLIIRNALGPIRSLEEGAKAISEGNYEKRIGIRRRDELGTLSDSFDHMAEAVQIHVEQVEQKEQEQRMLLRAISHETRTPVTAISGFAYAMNNANLSEAERQEAARYIMEESLRLERLTSKLTELIIVRNDQIEKKPVYLPDLAKKLQAILPDSPSMFVEADGIVFGDADLLLSFLTNICDNARKAHASRISVRLCPDFFRIEDDGDGIPSSALPHVTEPMFQADPSRHEGFGLGLSLCRTIAELHSGELQVQSSEGKGTTVTLTFLLQVHDDSKTSGAVE